MQWTWPNINKILASYLCENGTSFLIAVVFSSPVLSDSLWPRGRQHARHLCPSPSPEVCPSSCPLHWWCRPAISSSDTLFSFCPQSFPTSGTFPMSHLFASVHFSFKCSVLSDSLWLHGQQHTRLPCPSPTLRACLNSCPSSQWCHPIISSLLPLPSIFPSIRVFSSESVLCIRWRKYWSFSFSISPSSEYSRLISFRIDWFDLLTVQGTLESLLQHRSSKASILWCSSVCIRWPKYWSFSFIISPSYKYSGLISLKIDWFDLLAVQGTFKESSPAPQFESISSLAFCLLYSPALFFMYVTHWKRLWCWEGLGAGGERDDRGWDGWMASLTWWTWVWVNSGSWWWTGRPGILRFMGWQRVGHNWVTELNWTELNFQKIKITLTS